MKKNFINEDGVLLYSTTENTFIPRREDTVIFNGVLYVVSGVNINYDSNIILIDIDKD